MFEYGARADFFFFFVLVAKKTGFQPFLLDFSFWGRSSFKKIFQFFSYKSQCVSTSPFFILSIPFPVAFPIFHSLRSLHVYFVKPRRFTPWFFLSSPFPSAKASPPFPRLVSLSFSFFECILSNPPSSFFSLLTAFF